MRRSELNYIEGMNRIINIVAQTSHHSSVQRQMNDIVDIVFNDEALGLENEFVAIYNEIKRCWELYIGDWDDKTEHAFSKALRMNKIDTQ